MQLKEIGEFGLIDRIKNIVDTSSAELIVGIGDDAAAFRSSKDHLTLVTTDALIEGVHFDLDYFTFQQLGWRALAVNLSDIAAMGGLPKYAVFSLGLPEKIQVESVEEFYQGAKEVGDKFQTAVIGGDTTQSPDRLFVSVTVVGEVEENKLTLRSGAQIGDAVFVTGTLGGAQAGLQLLKSGGTPLRPTLDKLRAGSLKGGSKGGVPARADSKHGALIEKHLTPQPRINEARFLVDNFPIHTMIDVSDGLASEINHICKQSGVGALLNADDIPIDSASQEAADLFKEKPLNFALNGGEDFELLFTAPEQVADALQKKFREKFGFECARIGTIKEQAVGIVLEDTDGKQVPILAKGYEHFGET